MNYSSLLAIIAQNIYENHHGEVTANMVKAACDSIVNSLGFGYQFRGAAAPGDAGPGNIDQRVFYIASTPGTYSGFGGLILAANEVALLKWDTEWHKETLDIPSKTQIMARLAAQDAQIAAQNGRLDGQDQEIADFEEAVQNQVDNYPMITINGNVTNAPDEEDITSVEENGNDVLKFKNRSAVDGMGYVILRKGGSNTFANQVTAANTIYEIRYDFELNNGSVTIPAGCVLKFNGGCLSNGTIDLNGSVIDADIKRVFNNVVLSNAGNDVFHAKWAIMNNSEMSANFIKNITTKKIDFDGLAITFTDNVSNFENGADWENGVFFARAITFGTNSIIKSAFISKSSEDISCSEDLRDYVGKIAVIHIGDKVPHDWREINNLPTIYRGVTSVIAKATSNSFEIIDSIEDFDAEYTYTSSSQVVSSIKSEVYIYEPIRLKLKNCKFNATQQLTNWSLIYLWNCKEPEIIDCSFRGPVNGIASVVGVNHCVGGYITNTYVADSYYEGTEASYGVQCFCSTRVNINYCTFENHRRAVDMSGDLCESRYNTVYNCIVTGQVHASGSCFGGHSSSYGNVFKNNVLNGGSSLCGFQLRGQNEVVDGNIVNLPALNYFVSCVINTIVRNNTISSNVVSGTFVSVEQEQEEVANNTIEIVGNVVKGSLFNISRPAAYDITQRFIIKDNVFSIRYADSVFVPATSANIDKRVVACGNTIIKGNGSAGIVYSQKVTSTSPYTLGNSPITKNDKVEVTLDLLKYNCFFANDSIDDSLQTPVSNIKLINAELYVNNVDSPKIILRFKIHFTSTNYANFLCFNFNIDNVLKLEDFVPSNSDKLLYIKNQKVFTDDVNETEVNDQRIIARCCNNTIYITNLCGGASGRLQYGYVYDVECEITSIEKDVCVCTSNKLATSNNISIPIGTQLFIGKPTWWNGTAWVDATGTPVTP